MSTARSLQQIFEDAGYEPRAYSGRGMNGKECLAVDFDGSIGKVFADVLFTVETEEKDAVGTAFRGMREDSMGLGAILCFPRVAFEARVTTMHPITKTAAQPDVTAARMICGERIALLDKAIAEARRSERAPVLHGRRVHVEHRTMLENIRADLLRIERALLGETR